MKRFFAVLAAMMLVFGVAGTAAASITAGNFVLSAYQAPNNTNAGLEINLDLGDFASVAALDNYATGITLGDFGISSGADLFVGGFAFSAVADTFTSKNYDMYVLSTLDDLSSVNDASLGFAGSAGTVYDNAVSGASQNKSLSTSYWTDMDSTGGWGSYAGLLTSPGDGGETDLSESVDMYLWHINWTKSGFTGSGTYTVDAAPMTALNLSLVDDELVISAANAVPVPAAAWLLGSGLLGLIGIRRRNA